MSFICRIEDLPLSGFIMKKQISIFFKAILLLGLALVYLSTLAPGLTWAHFGADGGDIVTAAATNGIAHPSGYPTYLLLARVYQYLPYGSLAYRTNLLSSSAAVLAAFFVYLLIESFLQAENVSLRSLIAFYASFSFGLTPLIWSQAVIAEVYTLNLFFFALILYLCYGVREFHLLDFVIGVVFGVAIGNHLTIFVLLPVIVEPFVRSWKFDNRRLFLRLAGTLVGTLVYLTLPLKASYHPALNWGNPSTLSGFLWLVSGNLYQNQFNLVSVPVFFDRIFAIIIVIVKQFGLPGFLLGLVGLWKHDVSISLHRSLLWISLSSIGFAIVYTTNDSFLYLLPALLSFVFWIAIGLRLLLSWQVIHLHLRGHLHLVVLFFLFILALQTSLNWKWVDASNDKTAQQFGEQTIKFLPVNSLVFARGDQAVFTLWYFHFGLGQRPDLVIIATDLLHFPWYVDTLRIQYPGLVVPGMFPFESSLIAANPSLPVCQVSYSFWAQIYCEPGD